MAELANHDCHRLSETMMHTPHMNAFEADGFWPIAASRQGQLPAIDTGDKSWLRRPAEVAFHSGSQESWSAQSLPLPSRYQLNVEEGR